mmetsp:Transcript_39293/g.63957  ORF Transcript_39293/g.63957 Transcript_39293/m.63957 type:complete len:467 (+) Transcript_39293:21-1421(+)
MAKENIMRSENASPTASSTAVVASSSSIEDTTASLTRDDEIPIVSSEEIARVVSQWTGIPLEAVDDDETERLMNLESSLGDRVIGQKQPVISISKAIRRSRMGLKDPHRPVASFIFSGPTGVGKTELAKALADSYFGSKDAMIRLDMSEFMERFSTSRLIGSPPGYVGFDDGGQLTEAVRRKPYSLILFDEIEKAHPDVFNIMLQILDDGRLTDSKGRTVDFTNTLIIMTSNVGSNLILEDSGISSSSPDENDEEEDALQAQPDGSTPDRRRGDKFRQLKNDASATSTEAMDDAPEITALKQELERLQIENEKLRNKESRPTFKVAKSEAEQQPAEVEAKYQRIKTKVFGELQNRFRPEFLNRLDEVIVFRPLQQMEVRRICELMLEDTYERMMDRNVSLSVSDSFKDYLVSEGFDPIFGARPLKRAVKRCLEDSLAEKMLLGEIVDGQNVEVDISEQGDLNFKTE